MYALSAVLAARETDARISIAKALELFLGLLIEESSKVTIERGSKKVEAYHLQVVPLTSLRDN